MARNQVQFQKGLGLAEFQRLYGTEDQCHDHLVAQRWPNGFVCPKCSGTQHSYAHARRIFQCSACRAQTSSRSGTVFHASRTPLTKWYLAIHLISSSKNDVASLELSRQLDVKWDTAWLIKQKLMEVMLQRNSIYSSPVTCKSTMPIRAAKRLENGVAARPTSSLSWSPSKLVKDGRSTRNFAAFRVSRRKRSRTMPSRISRPARASSAMASPASTASPKRGSSTPRA